MLITFIKYLLIIFSISVSQPCLSDFNNINPWNPYPLNTFKLDSMKRFGDEMFGDWIWRVQERDSLNRRTKSSILDYQGGKNFNSIEWVNYFRDSTEYIIKPAPSDSPLKDSNSTIETYYFTSNHIDSIKRFEWDSHLKKFRDYGNSHFYRNGDTLQHYNKSYVYWIDSLGNDSLIDVIRIDNSLRIIENNKVKLIQKDTLTCESNETSCFCVPINNSDTLFYHSYKDGAVDTSFFNRRTKDVGFKFWWNDKSSIQQSSSTQSSSSQIIVNNLEVNEETLTNKTFKNRIYSIDGNYKGSNIKSLPAGSYLIFETINKKTSQRLFIKPEF